MAWELTVSDKLGSWSASGKIFKPGIWVITNPDIAKAATTQDGVSVREVDETEARLVRQFRPAEPSGMLTRADFQAKVGADYVCTVVGCDSPPYATQEALDAHQAETHTAEAVTAAAEAAAATEAPAQEADEVFEEDV